MYLNTIQKHAALSATLALSEVRALPVRTLLALHRMLRGEKIVRIDGKTVVNSFLPRIQIMND